ncbi:MAG TPA: hypothetical protein DIT13_03640, partial [Verrucomicrobiales bacterium]|nr:hypothetical protein [Verrucomicrobiales bacterium]
MTYELLDPYLKFAPELCKWIRERIKAHITMRLGLVPQFHDARTRLEFASSAASFQELLTQHINKTPANFEIFSFAVLKVHLDKFACRLYRDTRTSSHDGGVDLSTNFGVVYQIKKLKLLTEAAATSVYTELKENFDQERLHEGNVILVIDDISRDVKQYLISMKVQ